MIQTERLILVPGAEEHLMAELDGRDALAAALGARVPDDWPPQFYDADAVRWALAYVRANPDHGGWSFYYLTLPAGVDAPAILIGAAGFKGPPDAHGEVELGYGLVPSHQRRGFATEAVRGMAKFAFEDPHVTAVVGQTIPTLVGSIGVLEKADFLFDGAGNDPHAPEGEPVLRYVLTRHRYHQATSS